MNKVSGDPPLGAWVTRLLGQPPQALLARPPSPPHTPLQPRGVSRASCSLALCCPLAGRASLTGDPAQGGAETPTWPRTPCSRSLLQGPGLSLPPPHGYGQGTAHRRVGVCPHDPSEREAEALPRLRMGTLRVGGRRGTAAGPGQSPALRGGPSARGKHTTCREPPSPHPLTPPAGLRAQETPAFLLFLLPSSFCVPPFLPPSFLFLLPRSFPPPFQLLLCSLPQTEPLGVRTPLHTP